MSVIALASLAGAPGVTTAAAALAVHWTRPVLLIEADTSAASSTMAGFFRANLRTTDGGIEKLAFALSRNALRPEDILDPELALAIAVHELAPIPTAPIPAIPDGHRMWVIPGFSNLHVVDGVRSLWGKLPALFDALDHAGFDVIIDLGRLDVDDTRTVLLDAADQVIFCATSSMVDLNRCYRRLELEDLAQRIHREDPDEHAWLLLNAPIAEVHPSKEFSTHVLPVLGTLPHDPAGASVFSLGRPDTKPARNAYRAGIRRIVADLTSILDRRSQRKVS